MIQGQAGDGRLYGSYSLADVGALGGLPGFYDYWSVDLVFVSLAHLFRRQEMSITTRFQILFSRLLTPAMVR